MKRFILVGILLLAFALAVAPTTSAYDNDDRDIVVFAGGTFDMDETLVDAGPGYGLTYVIDEDTLPAELGEFDGASSYVEVTASGDAIEYDLTINSVAIATDATLTDGNTDTYDFDALASAGVDPADTTIDFELSVNNTDWNLVIYVYADDAELYPTFFNEWVDFAETDVGTPDVGGVWVVNDTLTNNIGLDFTDTNFEIHYPSECVADSPDTTPWDNGDFSDGEEFYITYQKYGPAAENEDIDFTSGYGTVTLTFDSDDELKDADWTLHTDDSYWEGAFNGIDYNSLNIEINGDALDEDDWEQGSIIMENVDIDNDDNEVIVSWTPSGAGTSGVTPQDTTTPPTEEVITLDTDVGGVPLWAVLAIAAVIVIAAIAIIKIEKK